MNKKNAYAPIAEKGAAAANAKNVKISAQAHQNIRNEGNKRKASATPMMLLGSERQT
jgi:hypothetical protein